MGYPDIYEENVLSKNIVENNLLKSEIAKLKNQIDGLKKEINILKNEKNILKNENINLNNENNTLQNELNIKIENSQINNSGGEIKNLKISNNINLEDINSDELISIQLGIKEQKLETSFFCKKKDIFIKIEEKFYDKYPEYKEYNINFKVNGRSIKRFKTIEENNIKNLDVIFLEILK